MVTMIDWLLKNILWGGEAEGLCFDRGYLGDRVRLVQCLYKLIWGF